MTETYELAWAAGFFDGEGWVGATTRGAKTGPKRYLQLGITQIDPYVLERFRSAVGGLGSVTGPYAQKGRWRPRYHYQLGSRAGVTSVMLQLEPFLSEIKRLQWETAYHVVMQQDMKAAI